MLNFWIGFLICFILIGVINTIILIALNKKETYTILKWVILISSPLTVILYFIYFGAYRLLWYFFGYSAYARVQKYEYEKRFNHSYFLLVHPFLSKKLKSKKYLYQEMSWAKGLYPRKYFEKELAFKNKKKWAKGYIYYY